MKKTYKYQLPQNKEIKGTNVRVENGEILVDVEFKERFEPQDGDFCVSDKQLVFILKQKINKAAYSYCGINAYGNIELNSCYSIENGRYATEQEKADFLERLEKELHKRWNAETKQLEDIRWKPKEGENYWFIDIDGEVAETIFTECSFSDKTCVAANNCFRTEEAAQPYADQIKEIFKNSNAE